VENSVTVAGRNGGRLLAGGKPGNKGGTGRPPNWLREFCDSLLASPKCKAAVRAILSDANHPAFATMWKAAGDRAHGKAEQPLQHSGTIVIREKREPRVLIADN
jgi:hypothetical protein